MTKLFVVRHGQDEDNAAGILNGRRDMPLTALGREQARAVAPKLKDKGIQVIFSSPLKRARETANIIADEIGRSGEVLVEQRLIERDFGVMAGRPIAEIPKLCAKLLETERVTYFLEAEGAETFPEVRARAERIIEEIKCLFDGKIILIVAHGDIGKMIQAVANGWTWGEGLRAPYIDNTGVLELEV